jgi:hypothetical protein
MSRTDDICCPWPGFCLLRELELVDPVLLITLRGLGSGVVIGTAAGSDFLGDDDEATMFMAIAGGVLRVVISDDARTAADIASPIANSGVASIFTMKNVNFFFGFVK